MGDWRDCTLGDVIHVKHGYAFKGANIITEPTDNILVTPGNFHVGGGFKSHKFKYFDSDYPDDYVLEKDQVVVTMTDLSKEGDTLGYPAKIPEIAGKVLLHNQRVGLVEFLSDEVNSDFVYWAMRTRLYQWFIVGSATGTSVKHTSPTRIKEYTFSIPADPEEQKAIVGVLACLDNKIDLLHRQNKTLESLAETLFRQTFIENASDDWEEKELQEVIDIRDGTHDSPKKKEIGKYLITSRHLNGHIVDYDNAYLISEGDYEEVNRRSKVNQGDILFSMIGTLGLIHYIYYTPDYAIKNIGLFRTSEQKWFSKFLYLLLKSPVGQLFVHESAQGSTQQYISLGSLRSFKFSFPGRDAVESFNGSVEPLFEKLFANCIQIQTLENLRDTLLPKLMSGEVRVQYDEAA